MSIMSINITKHIHDRYQDELSTIQKFRKLPTLTSHHRIAGEEIAQPQKHNGSTAESKTCRILKRNKVAEERLMLAYAFQPERGTILDLKKKFECRECRMIYKEPTQFNNM